jgi:histidyl-tRNA synthetase
MRTLLSETPLTLQIAVRHALDKRESDKATLLLAENGYERLVQPLLALTQATTLSEIFSIIGNIPQKERIEEMCQILDAAGVAYELSPAIARGLDYYTGVVFEAFAEGLGAENQIMGGGAYRLAHLFGGEDTPSVGFAIGFDRVMVALSNKQIVVQKPQVSIIYLPETRSAAVHVAAILRNLGICVDLDLTGRSFSAQMKNAGKIANAAIIIGEKENSTGTVTVKNLNTGEQVQWSLAALPEYIVEFMST